MINDNQTHCKNPDGTIMLQTDPISRETRLDRESNVSFAFHWDIPRDDRAGLGSETRRP